MLTLGKSTPGEVGVQYLNDWRQHSTPKSLGIRLIGQVPAQGSMSQRSKYHYTLSMMFLCLGSVRSGS
jgi:hypothetical protein